MSLYSKEDIKYMEMALRRAAKGLGKVEPNPAVGCIITKANQIIGKGHHKKFGDAHAEVNAIEDCKNIGVKPKGATMYVTLEPCCHHGKTGPCTDAIINAGIKKVFIATLDSSEHAGGKGVQKLRDAGVEVDVGLCQLQARMLNAGFLKHAKTARPWVILKWAQSIDGKLAWADTTANRWISNEHCREDVHAIRRSCQAIMVGVNTVITDNPLLTPRPAKGKSPLRVILDNNLRIPLTSRVLNTKGDTMVVCRKSAMDNQTEKVERLKKKNVQLLTVPEFDKSCFVEAILDELGRRNFQRILLEGGPRVFNEFIKYSQADQAIIYVAGKILGSHGDIDIEHSMASISEPVNLYHVSVDSFGNDTKISGMFKNMD